MTEISRDHFDVLVIGTGPTESFLAAALSRNGKKVVHVDSSEMYGGQGAVATLAEMLADDRGAEAVPKDQETLSTLLETARKYTCELSPKLIFANGELVSNMIASNVSNYLEFRALESTHLLWDGTALEAVPCSKEDIFKNESIGLLEKRRLMKLLSQFVMDDTKKEGGMEGGVEEEVVAEAVDPDAGMPFVEYLQKQKLTPKSTAMLFNAIGLFVKARDVAHGELDGVCAVHGGTYMLDYHPTSAAVEVKDGGSVFVFKSNREGSETEFSCNWIVSSPTCASQYGNLLKEVTGRDLGEKPKLKRISRSMAIYDTKLARVGEPGLIVIPPRSSDKNGVVGIQHSNNTLVCPAGKFVLYLWTESDETATARQDLETTLTALLQVGGQSESGETETSPIVPLVTIYYTQSIPILSEPSDTAGSNMVLTQDWSDAIGFEESLAEARTVFERIVGAEAEFMPAVERNDEDDE
ncbi:hypothetical protein HDU98_000255 [Podochytrium sp. JEL0797]|nr:hypothetical protein HDU98_000255 [Podochytrium sp. JEL0797]